MDNNFDFFVGRWTSEQRRLRKVLVDCDDWDEFPGISHCWSIFGGAGNVDEVTFPTKGFGGLTVRQYDAERDEWSLYWFNSTTGISLPPVVGRFTDGRGVFLADETYEGRPIKVRYMWSDITAEAARWEQAFSPDGGATWEINWIADFTRTE